MGSRAKIQGCAVVQGGGLFINAGIATLDLFGRDSQIYDDWLGLVVWVLFFSGEAVRSMIIS